MTAFLPWPEVDPVFAHGAAACLAILFLTSAWDKLREPWVFQAAVGAYRLLPPSWVAAFSWLLAASEVAAALLILFTPTRLWGSVLACALLLIFCAAMAINLLRGHTEIDCGCGGAAEVPLSWSLVVRNLALVLLALVAASPVVSRSLGLLDLVSVAGCALFAFGMYLLVNLLLSQDARVSALRRLSHPDH